MKKIYISLFSLFLFIGLLKTEVALASYALHYSFYNAATGESLEWDETLKDQDERQGIFWAHEIIPGKRVQLEGKITTQITGLEEDQPFRIEMRLFEITNGNEKKQLSAQARITNSGTIGFTWKKNTLTIGAKVQ